MKVKIFTLLTLSFTGFYTQAQTYIDTKIIGEIGFNVTSSISHQAGRDIFVGGLLGGDLVGDFPISYRGGNCDGILVQVNELTGDLQNVFHFGGGADEAVIDSKTDADGNIYVVGYFKGAGANALDADPGVNSYPLSVKSMLSSRDVFIIKLDASGTFVWAKQISNPGGAANEDAIAMEIDAVGNIYVVGNYQYADFDPGVGTHTLFSTNSGQYIDGFIVKLNPDGEFQWVSTLQGTQHKKVSDIRLDGDRIYVTGTYKGTIDLDPSDAGTLTFTSNGYDDTFLASYDLDGNLIWGKSFGGPGLDFATHIEVFNGVLYFLGSSSDVIQFGPSTTFTPLSSSSGFLATFDNLGDAIAVTNIDGGTTSSITTNQLFVSSNNTIVATGSFTNSILIDNSSITATGPSDNFYIKFDTGLSYLDHYLVQGTSNLSAPLVGQLQNDDFIMAGSFKSSAQFDYYQNSDILSTGAQRAIYLTHLSEAVLGVSNEEMGGHSVLYPNPTKSSFSISVDGGSYPVTASILDLNGKLLKTVVLDAHNSIDVSDLSKGVYLVNLEFETSTTKTIRLVKE